MSPYDTFNIGKATGSLTTHKELLPRPKEIRQLVSGFQDDPYGRRYSDNLQRQERRDHLQGKVDHHLCQVLVERGTACNSGHLVIPDYVVPGYTGCLKRNPTRKVYLHRLCYLDPVKFPRQVYECEHVNQNVDQEPCRYTEPIRPAMQFSRGRKECL